MERLQRGRDSVGMTSRTRAMLAFWSLAALAFAGLWLWGLAHTPLGLHETLRYPMEPVGEIRGAQSVGQTFRAPYGGLRRIEVALADFGRLNTAPVTFRLSAGPEAAEPLLVKTFSAAEVRGDTVYAIDFDPIRSSAGKTYYFEFESPKAVPGNAITAYVRPGAPYAEGSAYRAGQLVQGDLVFSAYFSVSLRERIKILLQQMTENKPLLWGDWRFYVGTALLYVVLLAALVRELVKLLNQPATEDETRRKE